MYQALLGVGNLVRSKHAATALVYRWESRGSKRVKSGSSHTTSLNQDWKSNIIKGTAVYFAKMVNEIIGPFSKNY